jgi:hypothetical protein
MKSTLESKLPNAIMQAAPRALRRAADHAREIARQTGTPLIVVRNGVLMEVDPDDVSLDQEKDESESDE